MKKIKTVQMELSENDKAILKAIEDNSKALNEKFRQFMIPKEFFNNGTDR